MPVQPVEGERWLPEEAETAALGRMSNAHLHCWKKYPKMKLIKSEKFLEAENQAYLDKARAQGLRDSANDIMRDLYEGDGNSDLESVVEIIREMAIELLIEACEIEGYQ